MSILRTILDHKRDEVAERRRTVPIERLRDQAGFHQPTRSFSSALGLRPSVIAEIKKASPSRGVLRADFDPVALAGDYSAEGARALSILTDENFFQGKLEYLSQVRERVGLPLLRKDFVIDSYQIAEARAAGADAILLIAAALEPQKLHDLHDEASALGLECLVEFHEEREFEGLNLDQLGVIGINNRDLATFHTDLETSVRLKRLIPSGKIVVSESGIRGPEDIRYLREHDIHAFLVGESLMQAPDVGAALRNLLGGGP